MPLYFTRYPKTPTDRLCILINEKTTPTVNKPGLFYIIRKQTQITSLVSSERGKMRHRARIQPTQELGPPHCTSRQAAHHLLRVLCLCPTSTAPPCSSGLNRGLNKDTLAQSSLEGRRVQGRLMALGLREFKPMARVYVQMCESKG